MATIGTVSFIQGTVVAEDAAGNQRTLTIGDDILDTEQIITSVGARIEINMVTGDNVVVENGQSWSPTAETFTNVQDFAATDATLSPEDLALQEALLAGADPTQLGEATAAGGAPGAAGTFGGADGGGSSFVRNVRLAGEVDPSAGYDTIGTSASLVGPIVDPQSIVESEILPTVGDDNVIPPIAGDDSVRGVTTNAPVTVTVLTNDSDPDGSLDVSTVSLTSGDAGSNGKTQTVTGEGVWTVNASGTITFTPEAGFTADPTSVNYTVKDNDGIESNIATVSIDYATQGPIATDDSVSGQTTNTAVTVTVLTN
ncbi:MAG: retention module-containing protein, partial [Pseudomonadales bacterium]|nr:retention module-containing protein [Pseudomonadales bacterium]